MFEVTDDLISMIICGYVSFTIIDKETALGVVSQDGSHLEYVSEELRNEWKMHGRFIDKKHLVCNTSCLIGMCEIKEGDSYYKCSNEKVEEGHYYLKENFDEWEKQSRSSYLGKCIYCFSNIIDTVFVNSDN